MASLTENTSRIANANENIKTSLLNKGAEFLEGDKIDTYSSKIDSLNVIQPGNYNVECYIRIDDVLVGDGIEFNVVGTDGTTQTATSRAAGFIYLTLNYGVGYDIQPVDTEKYYANSHELIYHIKEDGNYFSTDYYFYTARSGEEDWKITDCSNMFCENARLELFDNLLPHLSNQPINIKNMFKGTQSDPTNFEYIDRYFEIADFSKCKNVYGWCFFSIINDAEDKTINLNFPELTTGDYLFANILLKNPITLSVNVNAPKLTTCKYAFQYLGINSNLVKFTIELDLKNSTSNVTDFTNTFSFCSNGIVKIKNLNMDKVTRLSSMFYGCSSINQLTFSGSFGGLSTTTSLTLDLSTCTLLTIDSFLETMQTISVNTNGKTRIIKLSSSLYNSLTDEILDLADEKGYTLASA